MRTVSFSHRLINRRLRVLAAGAVLAVVSLTMVWASPATAHDVLVENVPADGAVLEESPEEIVLTFNNSVLDMGEDATLVRITDHTGEEIEVDAPDVRNRDVVTSFNELADGAYRVVWRVVSSDGHPIQGTFAFAVGPDGEQALAELPAAGDEPHSHDTDAEPADDANGISVPIIVAVSVAVVAIIAAVLVVVARRK